MLVCLHASTNTKLHAWCVLFILEFHVHARMYMYTCFYPRVPDDSNYTVTVLAAGTYDHTILTNYLCDLPCRSLMEPANHRHTHKVML